MIQRIWRKSEYDDQIWMAIIFRLLVCNGFTPLQWKQRRCFSNITAYARERVPKALSVNTVLHCIHKWRTPLRKEATIYKPNPEMLLPSLATCSIKVDWVEVIKRHFVWELMDTVSTQLKKVLFGLLQYLIPKPVWGTSVHRELGVITSLWRH